VQEGAVLASPPAAIAGLLEIRGLGLVHLPHRAPVRLVLVLDLGRRPERLPRPEHMEIAGVFLPCLAFDPSGPSAPLRAEWAVAQAAWNGLWCADAP
jgi:serine kinase of HPr protein (carbohydrate metabolism regulator)